jgi:transposase
MLRELVNSTLQDVSIKHRVSYDRLRGLLGRHVRGQVDWGQFTELKQIGLDEISLLKGHSDFVTIVSTRDQRQRPVVLGVIEGRKKEAVIAFLQSIPEPLRETVEEVCTDLYDGFIGAAQEVLPQARIVGDRFHVAKLYRAGLDELRILTTDQYAGLKGAMWALRRNQADLKPEERRLLELLFDCSPELRTAYELREKLTGIFETQQSPQAARKALRRWIAQVRSSGLDCFDKFITTLEVKMEIITNYFVHRTNSGWVEGLNNKIKVLKRRCYGISNPVNLFRRLWLDLNGYEAFAH